MKYHKKIRLNLRDFMIKEEIGKWEELPFPECLQQTRQCAKHLCIYTLINAHKKILTDEQSTARIT